MKKWDVKKSSNIILFASLAVSSTAGAIEIDGSNVAPGIQALYVFKNYQSATGTVPDTSGVGAAVNLIADKTSNVGLVTDSQGVQGLRLNVAAAIKSAASPAKIINACGASNEITIEAWVRNLSEEPVDRSQPVRIVSMARKSTDGKTHTPDFFLGQSYNNAGFYTFGLQSGATLNRFETTATKGILLWGSQSPAQHIVYTKDKNGVARLWRSNAAGLLLRETDKTNVPSIAGWASDANAANFRLSIGNDPFYADFPENVVDNQGKTVPGPEWKSWLGTIYVLGIYCRALDLKEVGGDTAPGATALPSYPVDPTAPISAERRQAHNLYKRLTGVTTPIDNPVVVQMESLITAGNKLGAALLATKEAQFLNVTVRDFAARMSNRDETANTPLNDMMATVIGVARDDLSAQQLLTGNFLYQADSKLASVPMDPVQDFLVSNNHYQALEDGRFDLSKVLVKVDGQKLLNGATNNVVLNPDAAGVLTSRAFMSAHAAAGTNRRMVEYSMREFLCIPINQWADVTGTDTYVGRDVDRAPGNDINKYKTTCRACHSVMDGFRGAFAKWDFSASYVKNADVMFGLSSNNVNDNALPEVMVQDPPGVAQKMNRNKDMFPDGNPVSDNSWVNNANQGLNKDYFGWPEVPGGQSTHRGSGLKSFATLVSQAKAFPRCMSIRAYRSVCKRDVTASEQAMIARVAQEFADQNYNLRELFARIAISPECLGQ